MEFIDKALGLYQDDLTWYQMSIRAVIVYFVTVINIRITGMRTFHKRSAFDLVTALILGAVLSRAIVGSEPFVPILLSSVVLVLLHKVISWLAFKNDWLSKFVKGNPLPLIQNGEFIQKNMRKMQVTEKELYEAIRTRGKLTDVSEVEESYFESDGHISIIPKRK